MTNGFLFIDTETTGFAKNGELKQEGQARVCQIAMLLTDEKGKSLLEFSALIKPDGWTIGEGAGAIHGFTNELCEMFGLGGPTAAKLFRRMASMSQRIIAHNSDFDRRMMEIECAYHSVPAPDVPWHCTMKTNTHITNGKWPKLEEALRHYCQRDLGEFAHDAMYDVKACRDIFFAATQMGIAA